MPFFLLLALGRLLDYLQIFPPGADKSLSLYVIYVALPALILRQVPELHFSGRAVQVALLETAMPPMVLLVPFSPCR
ncbi:MAG: hypothetical protein Q3M24_17765 [Candidatus Electrothrix aestuarii]|uniref:Uncharacterized protein n=1 Tax=Candidatus Electrothrix aestuarii TaxID=3062594 RepID=A0AAU8LS57_9BACT|nr:hypothetical protein [Candidatus Electrothrix aestuarii]